MISNDHHLKAAYYQYGAYSSAKSHVLPNKLAKSSTERIQVYPVSRLQYHYPFNRFSVQGYVLILLEANGILTTWSSTLPWPCQWHSKSTSSLFEPLLPSPLDQLGPSLRQPFNKYGSPGWAKLLVYVAKVIIAPSRTSEKESTPLLGGGS